MFAGLGSIYNQEGDIQTLKSQLNSNSEVLLEAVDGLLGQMVEKTVVAGN